MRRDTTRVATERQGPITWRMCQEQLILGYVVTGSKTSGESSALSSDESAIILALRKMNALDQEALTHVVGVMNRSAVPDGALPEMMNLGSGTCTEQRKSMLG